MKIAFLSPFNPYRGGIAQFSDLLYDELSNDNDVTAFNFTRQYPSILFPGKTQYVNRSEQKKNFRSLRVLDSINPATWFRTGKLLKNGGFSLLLISYWMPFFALSTGKPARIYRRSGGKVISIMHNVIAHENRPGDVSLTKYFLNSSDGFVVMNENSLNDMKQLKLDSKVKVLNHPIYSHYSKRIDKSAARKQLGIDENKKVLLFFGFIRDYKGYDILLEALKYLDDSYYLITAGEVYGSFSKYENIINKNELREKLMLKLDYISDEAVPLYFSAADVCILPYRSATQSGITATSYHFETPLIVTDTGGLSETIEIDGSGIIADKTEPEVLANAIKTFFSQDRYKMVQNIKNAKMKYSWQNFAKGILELYGELF
jgi:glycosyltransferase involved in cell wall biosynthesis